MNSKEESHFSARAGRRKNLIILAGLLALVLIGNGVVGLFALSSSNENHLADLQTLGQISKAMESARAAQVHFKKQVQEWKDILLRGSNPEDLAKYRALFEEEERLMDQDLASLSALVQKLNLPIPEIAELQKTHGDLGAKYRTALKDFRPEDLASALAVDKKVRGIDRAPTDQMDAIVAKIEARADELSKAVPEQTLSRYETLRRLSITGTSVGVLIVLIFLGLSFASLPKE